MGILCDVYDNSQWKLLEKNTDNVYSYMNKNTTGFLPTELSEKFTSLDELITMNDSGRSFNHIADYIEQHIELKEEINDNPKTI